MSASAFGGMTLVMGLFASVGGAVLLVVGARLGRADLRSAGRRATYLTAGCATLAVLTMEHALLTRDFSVGYVAEVGSWSTPNLITMISLWAALEGSILFWLWLQTMFAATATWLHRRRPGAEMPYASAILLGVSVFFFVVLVGPGDPFEAIYPVPTDGPGPNPLLQNHPLMAFHPPAQYLGYVGLSVPFAFGLAALITGEVDSWWITATRRWTLAAWGFLTLAIAAGGWWAYEVLGWGGYWAWDPVENAALMPWLVATAFLHSIMVQERRDMLRAWNVTLIVAAFALTILGTFLTRSGILGSVHAFTESAIGPLFLGFLALVLISSTALVLWRSTHLYSPGTLTSPYSREGTFILANLLFVALTLTVLLGTVFPLVAEAVRGIKVSVGAPYFNTMTVPFFAAVVFLMGVGPALPWRQPPAEGVWRILRIPFVFALVAAAAALFMGVRSFWPLVTIGFSAFAATVMGREIASSVGHLRRGGRGTVAALASLVRSNPRRYGGYVVHFGVVTVAVAIAVSWNYKTETEVTLARGESVSVGGYDVRFEQVSTIRELHRSAVLGELVVARSDRSSERLTPRLNFYPGRQQPVPTPAVLGSLQRDLFINLMAYDDQGTSATLKIVITPLVVWLWIGAGIMASGTMLAIVPRRGRRVVRQVDPPVEAIAEGTRRRKVPA